MSWYSTLGGDAISTLSGVPGVAGAARAISGSGKVTPNGAPPNNTPGASVFPNKSWGGNPATSTAGVASNAFGAATGSRRVQPGTRGVPVGNWPAVDGAGNSGDQTKKPYGTESGPGILESWFNQRANGTDPGYEYAMKRGLADIGNRSAAAGAYNSGAARQQESDFAANMAAQREGQLDALAGGASGEHMGRLNAMFGTAGALAGGQSGLMGAYDLASARTNDALMQALMQIYGNKAGVDSQSNKQGIGNVLGLISAL